MSFNTIKVNNTDTNYTHSIFDISEYTGKTYETLSDALADVPDGKKKGGMTVSFVSTSDNNYIQCRLMAQNFTTDTTQWQGCDNSSIVFSGKELITTDELYYNNVFNVPYTSADYRINIDGNFGTYTSYRHIYIPVSKDEKYFIKGIDNYVLRIAFATTNEATAGGVIPVVSGTMIYEIPANRDVWVKIPDTCTYLLLWRNDAGTGFNIKKPRGVDTKPISGSKNFVESDGIYKEIFTSSEILNNKLGGNFPQNGFINTTGAFVSNSGFCATLMIPVSQGENFWFIGGIGASGICVAGYSSDNYASYIQTILPGNKRYMTLEKFVIPSGVNYICCCSRLIDNHIILKDSLLNQKIDLNSNLILDLKSGFGCKFPLSGFIDASGGYQAYDLYHATEFISTIEGEKYYYIGGTGVSALAVAGYSDTTFVQAILGANSNYPTVVEFTIPQGITRIRACSKNEYAFLLIRKTELLNRFSSLVQSQILKNEYFGKTINWLGDSITAGTFDNKVCSYFGLNENDYGIGGSTIAANSGDTRNSMAIRYANMENNADVIVVSGGTNDYQYNWTPFGQLGDNTVDTFYGALDVLCRGLIAKYPNKLVFFTTPIKRNQGATSSETRPLDTAQDVQNSLGKYLSDYAHAIKEVCAKYSIPVCDLYSESYLNPNMTAQAGYFDGAGTHPNNTGTDMMARRVRGFMKQLC